MKSSTACLLLTKLNTGHCYLTSDELENNDDDNPFDMRREVNNLVKDGIICSVNDDIYKITVDIYTLRKIMLGATEKKTFVPKASGEVRFSSFNIADSVWHIKNGASVLSAGDSVTDCADEDDEAGLTRLRREYLEKRWQELTTHLFKTGGEDDDEPDDDEPDDDEDNTESKDDFMRKKLLAMLSDESNDGKLIASALKICERQGHISAWLLRKTLGIDENKAGFICMWLYVNDITKKDSKDSDKYVMDIPESMFLACCSEIAERGQEMGGNDNAEGEADEDGENNAQSVNMVSGRYMRDFELRRAIRAKLSALLRTDLKMTRAKAITKAEGCLCAARDIGNDKAVAVYERVVSELSNMSDYMFNRLKKRLED